MPGADPFGPHFTHYHSEGQPPYRPRSGSRPITASGKEGPLPRDPLYYVTKHLQHFTAAERNQSHQGLHLRADRRPRHGLAIGMPIALTPSSGDDQEIISRKTCYASQRRDEHGRAGADTVSVPHNPAIVLIEQKLTL